MITVTHLGTRPERPTKIGGTCPKCGTAAECLPSDATEVTEGGLWYIECPLCTKTLPMRAIS